MDCTVKNSLKHELTSSMNTEEERILLSTVSSPDKVIPLFVPLVRHQNLTSDSLDDLLDGAFNDCENNNHFSKEMENYHRDGDSSSDDSVVRLSITKHKRKKKPVSNTSPEKKLARKKGDSKRQTEGFVTEKITLKSKFQNSSVVGGDVSCSDSEKYDTLDECESQTDVIARQVKKDQYNRERSVKYSLFSSSEPVSSTSRVQKFRENLSVEKSTKLKKLNKQLKAEKRQNMTGK